MEEGDEDPDAPVPQEQVVNEPVPQERVSLMATCEGMVDDTNGDEAERVTMMTITAKLVNHVASFTLTRPEMLRMTPAFQVLRGFGNAVRGGAYSDELYRYSWETPEIQQFWSHSWHGRPWEKICLLFVVCNGFAALVSGSCAVALALPLIIYVDGSIQWCLLAGLVSSVLALLVWRPRTGVFFDKVCIEQTNPTLLSEGVVNVGACMKHSKSMLVCWDATYLTRLWCLVEMAAFLKTHSDSTSLTIRPASWGPTAILLFLTYWAYTAAGQITLCVVDVEADWEPVALALVFSAANAIPQMLIMPFVAHFCRRQMEDLEKAQAQLAIFSFDRDATCHCCIVGHVHPESGSRMSCDFEAMRECVCIWFGSTAAFEAVVQDKVASIFREQFQRHPLPYPWVVGATITTLWLSICDVARNALAGADFVGFQIFANMAFWLAGFPVLLYFELQLAHLLRRRRSRWWQELLLNLVVAASGCAFMAIWVMVESLWIIIVGDAWAGSAAASLVWIFLAILIWRPAAGCR